MNPRAAKLKRFYCCLGGKKFNNFTYYTNAGGTLTTEFYLDNSNKVIVPSTYNGTAVTEIGNTTFIQNLNVDGTITGTYDLEQVTIPEGVTKIS